jgi:hypothetical protein
MIRHGLTLVCISLLVGGCSLRSRPATAAMERPATLAVATRVEHLDTLTREPMLVEHPSGALFVAGYNGHRLGLWKSMDRGTRWTRVDVGSESQGAIGNSDVDLAVAPDGTLYFVSMGYDRTTHEGTHVAIGVSRDVGATWRWTMVSQTRFDDRPWVAVASDGTAHVIWNDGHGVNHVVSRDRGVTWTRMGRVYDRGGSSHLAVGPQGEVAVRVAPGAASGNKCDEGVDLIAVSTNAGATWRTDPAPGGPRPSGCGHHLPEIPRWVDPIAWDAAGALYSLWTDSAGVWLGRSTDHGTTWASWRIAEADAVAYYPYLVARARGELAATWFSGVGDSLRWRAARINVRADGTAPTVIRSAPIPLESWFFSPPRPDPGGEYLAISFLSEGDVAVVTPIQHESAHRLGFTWWRFEVR